MDSCKTFLGNVLRKFRVVLILLACVVGVTMLWSKTGEFWWMWTFVRDKS